MLIDTNVFEELATVHKLDKHSMNYFEHIRDNDGTELSEDLGFCLMCNDIGTRIAIDLDEKVGHIMNNKVIL